MEKKIDFEEPTPLLDQVFLGCTQRGSETSESDAEIKSVVSADTTIDMEAKSKIKNPQTRKVESWSCDMKTHMETRCCEVAHKFVEQLSNVSTPCMDDHQFTKDEFEIVGELADVCAQIALHASTSSRSTRHRMDSQCTRKSCQEMEQSV